MVTKKQKANWYIIRCHNFSTNAPCDYSMRCFTRSELRKHVSSLRESFDYVVVAKVDHSI